MPCVINLDDLLSRHLEGIKYINVVDPRYKSKYCYSGIKYLQNDVLSHADVERRHNSLREQHLMEILLLYST